MRLVAALALHALVEGLVARRLLVAVATAPREDLGALFRWVRVVAVHALADASFHGMVRVYVLMTLGAGLCRALPYGVGRVAGGALLVRLDALAAEQIHFRMA